MRFNYTILAFFGTAISLDVTFSPLNRPASGETIRAGSVFMIEWSKIKDVSGRIDISLHNGELADGASYDGRVEDISTERESTGKFEWHVNSTLPAGDQYYIQIDYLDEIKYAILSKSSDFKIQASNGSTHTTSSSTTQMPTGSSTISSSGTATSTSNSGVTTHISPPFVFVGAAFVGMLAF
ncbi:cell wall beta-glucan synthesis [Penicillium concentricum]|uniref:Cell wall beta-glucan synthesis n=1 Tax=Penicillium concentricum TaxID=293559 RepID=A0A9W9SQN4_9EURO|nr:cell wall beta-glucan synthesis [Penicillium concentricum]KAJ5382350.1 cell wall beta-glucan synthesis [Penicillium concentricum]